MEGYINALVDNTFKNYEFEQAKKIIADKILWYEMKLLNSVDKDKIKEKIKYYQEMGKDIHGHWYYENEIELLEDILEESE